MTCKKCKYYTRCMERSRMYPCTQFKPFLAVLIALTIVLLPNVLKAQETDVEHIEAIAGEEAKAHNISVALIYSIIEQESTWNVNAINTDNGWKYRCVGLMQIAPYWQADLMEELGVSEDDLYTPEGNIKVGVEYLSRLADEYGDIPLALDLYNGNSKAFQNYENGVMSKYAKEITDRAYEWEKEWDKCKTN